MSRESGFFVIVTRLREGSGEKVSSVEEGSEASENRGFPSLTRSKLGVKDVFLNKKPPVTRRFLFGVKRRSSSCLFRRELARSRGQTGLLSLVWVQSEQTHNDHSMEHRLPRRSCVSLVEPPPLFR